MSTDQRTLVHQARSQHSHFPLAVTDQAPAVIWATDQELRFTASHGAALQRLNLRPNEVVGMTLFDFFRTEDSEFPAIALHRAALRGLSVSFQMDWGGQTYQSHVSPLRDQQGTVIGCIGVALDVTECLDDIRVLAERLRFEELLSKLSADFISVPAQQLDQTTNQALREVGEFLGVDRGLIFQFSEDREWLSCTHQWFANGRARSRARLQDLACKQHPWLSRRYLDGEPVVIASVEELGEEAAAERETLRQSGVKSMLSVPLQVGSSVFGVVCFDSLRTRRNWPDRVLTRLKLVGDMFANALQRQLVEQALRDSEQRFRQMAENIDEVYWLTDWTRRTVLYISPAYQRIWGVTCQTLYDDARSWAANIHPDDRQRVVDAFEQHAASGGYNEQYRIVHRDGSIRWIHDRAFPIRDATGKVYRVAGVSADITRQKEVEEALRESEQRFRILVEQAADAFFLRDQQGNLVDVNHQACKSLGYTRDELLNMSIQDIVVNDSPTAIAERTERVCGGQRITREGMHRRRDGSTFPVEARIGMIESGGGPLIVALARNVTQRKEAERQLRLREAELAHVDRVSTMGQLAAEMAHEINQPLYAIANYAEACQTLLQSQHASSECLEWTRKISEQADRAGEIIRHLNQFVRKAEPHRTTVDLNQLIDDVIKLLEVDARHQQVHIQRELDPQLPQLSADKILIEQVLVNLMRNGFEAMSDTDPQQRLLTVCTACRGRDLEVSVSDTGHGLGSLDGKTLFEPFFTTKPNGLGLGLSICRSTVEAHRGTLQATSNADGGATFRLTLPAEGAPPGSAACTAPATFAPDEP